MIARRILQLRSQSWFSKSHYTSRLESAFLSCIIRKIFVESVGFEKCGSMGRERQTFRIPIKAPF